MAGGRESREAFVTLATNDTYSLGCLVLGNSLRNVAKTTRQLVVMVTQGVSQSMRNQLSRVFDMIYDVNLLDSRDSANLQLLGRPDLSCTFTKLHCWRLTMYDKAVFLDADTLVLQNVDELFDREELSAAPDAGWPDCFNSGVFVFQPSEETYNSLLNYAMSQGSFDGGDQGLLNMYFRDWATKDINKHLPFIYNVVSQAFYSYLPAFTQFKQDVKIVHFIGATKPWHHPYNTSLGEVTPLPETGHSKEFLQRWWNIFMQFVQPFLDPSLRTFQYSDRVSLPPPTFPAIIPYVPPTLDQVFYPNSQPNEHSPKSHDQSQVVEVPVVTRLYSDLESHYSEAPLSNINPENPNLDIYSVQNVVNRWAKANERKNGLNSHTVESSEHKSSHEHCETSDSTKGGLIGDLAAMRVHSPESMGSDQSLLSDQERKLNWERGQMDYLGADKFENIQAKLDKSLKGPPSSSDYTSSPFRPPTDGPPPERAPSKPESSPAPAPEVVSPPKNDKPKSKLAEPKQILTQPAKTESSTPAPAPEAKQTTATAPASAPQKTEAANKQTTAPASAAPQKTEAVKKQTTAPVVTKVSQPATTTSSVAKPQATAAGTAATKPQATKPAPQSEASKTAQPKTAAAAPSTAKPGLKTEVPKAGGAPSAFSKPAQPSSGSTAAAKSPTSSSAPSGKGGIASRLPWLKK